MVYIFLKYGIEKVKWSVILVAVVVTWIMAIVVGMLPYISDLTFNNAGFCESNPKSIPYIILISVVVVEIFLAMCVTIA